MGISTEIQCVWVSACSHTASKCVCGALVWGHTDRSCVIYLHSGPGDQPDHSGSGFGGDVCPCQAVKPEEFPESPMTFIL